MIPRGLRYLLVALFVADLKAAVIDQVLTLERRTNCAEQALQYLDWYIGGQPRFSESRLGDLASLKEIKAELKRRDVSSVALGFGDLNDITGFGDLGRSSSIGAVMHCLKEGQPHYVFVVLSKERKGCWIFDGADTIYYSPKGLGKKFGSYEFTGSLLAVQGVDQSPLHADLKVFEEKLDPIDLKHEAASQGLEFKCEKTPDGLLYRNQFLVAVGSQESAVLAKVQGACSCFKKAFGPPTIPADSFSILRFHFQDHVVVGAKKTVVAIAFEESKKPLFVDFNLVPPEKSEFVVRGGRLLVGDDSSDYIVDLTVSEAIRQAGSSELKVLLICKDGREVEGKLRKGKEEGMYEASIPLHGPSKQVYGFLEDSVIRISFKAMEQRLSPLQVPGGVTVNKLGGEH